MRHWPCGQFSGKRKLGLWRVERVDGTEMWRELLKAAEPGEASSLNENLTGQHARPWLRNKSGGVEYVMRECCEQ